METYNYNYSVDKDGKENNLFKKIDNEKYYYLIMEFENNSKYISKPYLTREEAKEEEVQKLMYERKPWEIKKSIVINCTEAQINKEQDELNDIKIKYGKSELFYRKK